MHAVHEKKWKKVDSDDVITHSSIDSYTVTRFDSAEYRPNYRMLARATFVTFNYTLGHGSVTLIVFC